MSYELIPFEKKHLSDAVALFAAQYERARDEQPLLPTRSINEPEWIEGELAARLQSGPGVVCLDRGQVVGYMQTCFRFPFKGQQAALCGEYAHAALGRDRMYVYQLMYRALSQSWVAEGCHLHLCCHLAADTQLKDLLYQLGFGAILAERLRDLSSIQGGQCTGTGEIAREGDSELLLDLHAEHMEYYRHAPIFVAKDYSREGARAQWADMDDGDVCIVYREGGEICAYFVVGESGEEEGFLLRETNTAEVKMAYVQPALRGRGVGAALLDAAVNWAIEEQYDRLFVEHETANMEGSRFWQRYFDAYVQVSMRYVDRSL